MDTNINNYSYNEILNVLKIKNNNIDINSLYNKTINIIDKIKNNYNNDNNNDNELLINFIKNCFIKICFVNNFKINKKMCLKLNIPVIKNKINENFDYVNNKFNNDTLTNYNIIEDIPRNVSVPNNFLINTKINDYSKGLVNPINIETITSVLIINSKFLTNNSNVVDYTVELNEPYTNVVSIKLSSVELVNSYYPISNYLKSNIFRIISFEYDPTSPTPNNTKININNLDIIINDGSYTINEIIIFIKSIISSSTIASVQAIDVNFNINNGKLNFFLKSPYPIAPTPGYEFGFDIDFSITNETRETYLNLGWLLGFSDSYYDFFNNYNFTPNNIISLGINSNFPVNLIGTSYFLIEVDDYNKNNPIVVNYNCNSNYSFNINNILAKLPNTSSTNSLIFEDSSDRIFKTRKYFGPVRIKKLRIRLLDENGKVVNLNNSNFSITLEIVKLNK